MPPNKQETACGRHAGSAFEINSQKQTALPGRKPCFRLFSSPPGNVFFIAAVRNPPPSF